jgi:hypothetical protein
LHHSRGRNKEIRNKEIRNKEIRNKEIRNKEIRNKEMRNKEIRNKEPFVSTSNITRTFFSFSSNLLNQSNTVLPLV